MISIANPASSLPAITPAGPALLPRRPPSRFLISQEPFYPSIRTLGIARPQPQQIPLLSIPLVLQLFLGPHHILSIQVFQSIILPALEPS